MILRRLLKSGFCSLVVLVAACGAQDAAARAEPPGDLAAQRAFFEKMRALCGQTFGGRTILAPVTDDTFEPARLYFTVETCGEEELRIPFIVGDDDSRTWILQLGENGLSFVHEHLRPDGSPHEVSGFGGHASVGGTADFQSFPDFWADEDTPPAEHRIWRLAFEREHDLFVYYLDRGGQPAYRLVFYLGPPSPPRSGSGTVARPVRPANSATDPSRSPPRQPRAVGVGPPASLQWSDPAVAALWLSGVNVITRTPGQPGPTAPGNSSATARPANTERSASTPRV